MIDQSDGLHSALILLGSNVEREYNMPAALKRLANHPDLRVTAVSSLYESAAIGGTMDAPVFTNAAVAVETYLPPIALRQLLRQLEAALGRVRTADKFAPRPIDLDIVMYDDLVMTIEGSQIPEPEIERRAYIAVPLSEVAPHWMHPQTGQTLHSMAQALSQSELRCLGPAPSLTTIRVDQAYRDGDASTPTGADWSTLPPHD